MTPAAPDLEVLRSFVTTADLASFSRAAERLCRTQSTISLHVKRVEETYGQLMFRRNGRSVKLTDEGEILLSYARKMLDLHQTAQDQLTRRVTHGVVRVGIPEDFATKRLPAVLSEFGRKHPGAHIEVCTAISADILRNLGEGLLDLAVARQPLRAQAGEPIWREPLVWVGPKQLRLDAIRPLPLVLFPSECYVRPLVLAALEASAIEWTLACTSSSLAAVQAAVAAGLGVTVLARSTINADLLEITDPQLPSLPDTQIAIFRRTDPVSSLVEHVAGFLKESMTESGPL